MSAERAARATVWGWATATGIVQLGLEPPAWNPGTFVAYWVLSLVFGFPVAALFCLALEALVTTIGARSKALSTLLGAALVAPFVKILASAAIFGATWRPAPGRILFFCFLGPLFVSETGFGLVAVVPAGALAGWLVGQRLGSRTAA